MKGKLYIKTHGCQMNEYDSMKMADVLAVSHGLELTDREDEADVILINTCSIREKAQEKVFSQLGRWKQLKRDNPQVVIDHASSLGAKFCIELDFDSVEQFPFIQACHFHQW